MSDFRGHLEQENKLRPIRVYKDNEGFYIFQKGKKKRIKLPRIIKTIRDAQKFINGKLYARIKIKTKAPKATIVKRIPSSGSEMLHYKRPQPKTIAKRALQQQEEKKQHEKIETKDRFDQLNSKMEQILHGLIDSGKITDAEKTKLQLALDKEQEAIRSVNEALAATDRMQRLINEAREKVKEEKIPEHLSNASVERKVVLPPTSSLTVPAHLLRSPADSEIRYPDTSPLPTTVYPTPVVLSEVHPRVLPIGTLRTHAPRFTDEELEQIDAAEVGLGEFLDDAAEVNREEQKAADDIVSLMPSAPTTRLTTSTIEPITRFRLEEEEDERHRLEQELKHGEGMRGTGTIPNNTKDKNSALWSDEIEEYFKGNPHFAGVISSDQIDELPSTLPTLPYGYIMNLSKDSQPGTHWVAVNITPDSIEYYDPTGMPPSKQWIEEQRAKLLEWKLPIMLKLKVYGVKGQDNRTNNCGFFSIRFLDERFHNNSFANATRFKRGGSINMSSRGEAAVKKEFKLI